MISQAYMVLREDVRKHLASAARLWLAGELKAGRTPLRMFEPWVAYYSDLDAVDCAVGHARRYGEWCSMFGKPFPADWAAPPGIADYARVMAGTTAEQNQKSAVFWDAVADRFEEFRAEHCEQLQLRAGAIMRHLDAYASEMPAERVAMWAKYGQALDEEAAAFAAMGGDSMAHSCAPPSERENAERMRRA